MPTTVVHDRWDAYPVDTEQGPMFVLFDVEAAQQQELQAEFPCCARIIIPIKEPNHNGGPQGEERERLDALEDELCGALSQHEVKCRLVGRLTFRGVREIVFQVADYETFRPHVGAWLKAQTDYEIDVSEHEGWEFFFDCLAPSRESWQWIKDRQVVERLMEAGSDPDKPHRLEFVFCGPPPGLRQLAETLAGHGYEPGDACDFNSGTIILTDELPLDLAAIFDRSLIHLELADANGVEYDGWGTYVVK